jgi:small-conductance mechanosensitive channel
MTFYKFAVGAALTAAMLAVLGFGALVFSARDFQYGVRQIAGSTNGVISFARLAEAERRIDQIMEESSSQRGEKVEIEKQLAALDSAAGAADGEANQVRAVMVRGIAEIEQRATAQPGASAAADITTQGLTHRVNTLASRAGLAPNDQQNVANLRVQAQSLSEHDANAEERNKQRAALATRQQLVQGQVDEVERRISALQEGVVSDYQFYEQVRGEAEALRTLSPLGLSAHLAQGHPALLSTLLVLLMGALGSLLYLFPAYLNRAQPVTMAEIAVRLIFGMCAALAVYVLANAAVSSFSFGAESSEPGTSSQLNPFTVSMFGIVAGVLSEDIAKWIQDRGRGVFTQGGSFGGADAGGDSARIGSAVNPHGGPDTP